MPDDVETSMLPTSSSIAEVASSLRASDDSMVDVDVDAVNNPFQMAPHGFLIAVTLVVVLGAMMLSYFKYKKWL